MLKRVAKALSTLAVIGGMLTGCQLPHNGQLPSIPLGRGLNQPLLGALNLPKTSDQFMWGVSSAGYQCEGDETNSQWYYWELAGKTKDRAGKAVDFYHRYEDDILLAKQMGTNAFRVSVEWSRIEPRPGVIDQAQLAFYKNLVQTIRKHGMEPLVTLTHFTYPHWLDFDTDRDGLTGFEDPDVVDAYLNYVGVVVRELSPEVKYWLTFNEPNIWLIIAHLAGKTPPGGKSPFGFLRAARNVLQAHARAYDRIHGIRPDAMVSSNIFQFQYNPFARRSKTYAASASALSDQTIRSFTNSDWFMESFEDGQFAYEPHLRAYFKPQDYHGGMSALETTTVSLLGRFDYVSFDYYYRFTAIEQILHADETWRMPIYPQGLYNVLMAYQRRFRKPIVIAENGIGTFNDQPRADGWKRADTIVQHVQQMQRAIADGANVTGYYHWSITDNYEWGTYDSRFGLYRVEALKDPELKRIPTDGVAAYQAVIANQGATPGLVQQYPGPNFK
ncbi:MAG TPA: glycoside hydrolase family 1 protein [Candidatus Obscuribacterales bacterium]